ncbi:hypothetical protein [Ruminococcus flavefaciens]|uniref:hypothetical protein n=1 Tax=Ruminococcus flavefaciens TaxID=1265 RepID=UPI0026EBDB6F|nr:hypothetical protein [Ruminococcus flavefaciens]
MGVKVATIPFELSSTGTVTQEYLDLFEFADDTYGEGAPVTDAADTYSTKGSSKLSNVKGDGDAKTETYTLYSASAAASSATYADAFNEN